MSQNADRHGRQKGAQQHAEGQHGDRTHARFQEQLQTPPDESDNIIASHREGKHRLAEHREQHDKANIAQEQNRHDEEHNR